MQLDRLLEEKEEAEREARLRRWAKAALAVAVILTVLLSLLTWRAARQATETVDWVAQTQEVMTVLESLLRHSLDVETGGRGFAETGSVPFLEPYESGRPAVVQDLNALRRLLVTPDQLQRLNVLEGQTNNQGKDVEEIVSTRQNTGKILSVGLFEQGKHDMDGVRITVEQMEVAERELLALRMQHARAAQHSSSVVIALGSLLVLSIAGMTVSRVMVVSAGARAQLKALNADLEQRVEQRTAALQSEVAVRKRTEEMRERLAAIVDSSDDAIVSKTLDGTISAWNRGAEKVFGYSAAEIVGKPMLVLLPPERIDEESGILAHIRSGERVDHFETVRVRKDGTRIDVSVTISPIRDRNGAIVGVSKVARDITRRKTDELEIRNLNEELEERIAKRTEELAAANHELEAFSYSVSHDLRVPLRHIAGFSRILVNNFGPVMAVEAREYLQLIEEAVRRMGLLVEGLLNLAKLGHQSLNLCRTELNAIVNAVISILEPECEGREVEWRIAKLPALECDPILMTQVFQNLLGNALKYSRNRPCPVIEVDSIQQPGRPPVIFVRDNGAGFNREYADRLFGVFQRFHTDSEFEGTGVGLAMVHRIIQKHGGTIWAESEVDHGATFYFALQSTEKIGATPKATAASRLGR
jgi:PAS domain S-box-containing protein